MGMGTNIFIIMLIINIFLVFGFPVYFQDSFTETILNIGDVGIDINAGNTTYDQTKYYINTTDSNATEFTEKLGIREQEGIFATIVNNISAIIQTTIGFIFWIVKFLFAPITIMSQIQMPWQIKLIFSLPFVVGYMIAVFQAWSGHEF